MKVRDGFVSNSSTTTFICAVCGTVESGMDAGLTEFGACECVEGHELCTKHIPKYMLKELNKTKQHVVQQVKQRYGNWDKFKKEVLD